jgi:hypothetical protein
MVWTSPGFYMHPLILQFALLIALRCGLRQAREDGGLPSIPYRKEASANVPVQ